MHARDETSRLRRRGVPPRTGGLKARPHITGYEEGLFMAFLLNDQSVGAKISNHNVHAIPRFYEIALV